MAVNILKSPKRKYAIGLRFYFFVWLLCSVLPLWGVEKPETEIVVAGQVVDKTDGVPLARAVVNFEGSNIATSTDDNGFFVLRSPVPQRKITVSMLGYKTRSIRLPKGRSAGLQIELSYRTNILRELVIFSSSDNSANQLIQRVRSNRKQNNPGLRSGYQPSATEQIRASMSNVTQKDIDNRLLRDLEKGIITAADSTLLLPVYESEKTYTWGNSEDETDFALQRSIVPRQSEILKELANKLPREVNFYENYIPVFGKNFLTPLATSSSFSYKYFLKDSLITPEGKQYIVSFRPRNPKDLTFAGEMRIDSASAALVQISASVPHSANINYIGQMSFTQDFGRDSLSNNWEFASQFTGINLQLINQTDNKKTSSFFVTKHTRYTDSVSSILPFSFTPTSYEKDFSNAIDSLSQTRVAKVAGNIADMFLNRYIHIGKIDWGPIFHFAGYNKTEGNRFTLSGRTGESLFKNFTVGGSAGYGFLDEKWKFGAEAQYRFRKLEYALIGLRYKDDFYQTDYDYHDDVKYENAIGNGLAGVSTVIFHGFGEKYSRREFIELFYDRQWTKGVNTHFSLQSTVFSPNSYVPFALGGQHFTSLHDYRLTLSLRLSYKERVMDEYFHRIYVSNNYPVLHFVVEGGRYKLSTRENYYLKLHIAEKQRILLGNIGRLNYSVEGGCIMGSMPFPLLEIYSGYENYGMDKLNLNSTTFNQYATDLYFNIETKFVTNGLLFNRIPLIKKLNLRELISAKLTVGNLHERQLSVMDFPSFIKPLNEPYLLATAGITNLFRILSVEALMEMPQTTVPSHTIWGIRLKLDFDF
ncbi:MAG: DUF5686 and carboxypeptidase regulatory-like domain-containing protein [Prevotellaceae bacterium]|jgi:hypothetical protein|nr:DUF5686 and carboxypeptidase regulatory-like domain-containing protein [Prevotellaceae bacterium]